MEKITDETIEYVSSLAMLELSAKERETARQDLGRMLDYMDILKDLDTDGVEPMTHAFQTENVFREDVVTGNEARSETLQNAPDAQDGMFRVPSSL